MEEYSLEGIRHDSIRRVFACIPEKGQISRLEISDMTGLSLMTVGKITDALLEKGVVTYAKSDSHSVGRKAKHISLAHDKYILTLELDAGSVYASFVDTSLCKRYSFSYKANKEGFTDGFLEKLMPFIFENNLVGTLVGVGVTSEENEQTLARELASVCESTLSVPISLVSDTLCAKVRAASGGKKVLYFVKADGGVRVAEYDSGVRCSSVIQAENARELEIAIAALTALASPDEVYSEFESAHAHAVDTKKASELTRVGIAQVVREAYLLS